MAEAFCMLADITDPLSPCDMTLMLPGVLCYQVRMISFPRLNALKACTQIEQALRFHASEKREENRLLTKKLKPEKKSSSKRLNPVDVKDGLRVLKYRAPHEKANHIFKKGAGDAHDDENTPWRKRLPNQTFGYTPCHHPGFTCDEAGDDCSCHVNEFVFSLGFHSSLIKGDNRSYCDKFCDCEQDCDRRFKGCYHACHSAHALYQKEKCVSLFSLASFALTAVFLKGTDACPCFHQGRECDPDLCCGRGPMCLGNCDNMQIQLHKGKVCAAPHSFPDSDTCERRNASWLRLALKASVCIWANLAAQINSFKSKSTVCSCLGLL
jgi:hypothetical protein